MNRRFFILGIGALALPAPIAYPQLPSPGPTMPVPPAPGFQEMKVFYRAYLHFDANGTVWFERVDKMNEIELTSDEVKDITDTAKAT